MKRALATLAGLAAAATVAASPANAQTAPSCVPGTIAKDKISFQLYNFLIPVFGAFPIGNGQYFPPGGTPNTPGRVV